MPETIENFVAKLQADGVQAGQAKADELIAAAEEKAKAIIADAQAQADKKIADAENQAQSRLARSDSELNLAARDTIAKLRQTLCDCLNTLVEQSSQAQLEDVDFIGKVLKEIIDQYVLADLSKRSVIHINVSHESLKKLKDWAIATMGQEVVENVRPMLNIKDKLSQAGFEYTVDNGTIEVTRDSVTELLSGLVTPGLRKVIDNATEKQGKDS